ncbi:hypothetical protein [Dyella sp.]|uniref:hypothetical protein n=1 Tax=Dyella sp. TaxID=1869338 RepID=UPI002D783F59|nr:hypothetical protein [Dyella sp.]HET7331266.1 hypothetical protein [Dyella sp.]
MNYPRVITLLALCAAISACDVSDTTMANGRITLKDNVVTLHADDAPDALVGSSGNLQIGDATVPVTPAQHGLLMLYFQNVNDVHQIGAEMGKVGAGIGVKALKDSFDGKSKAEQDQHAEAGAGQIKALARKMCQDLANVKNVQDQLAAQLSAFKPYADIMTGKYVTDCEKD